MSVHAAQGVVSARTAAAPIGDALRPATRIRRAVRPALVIATAAIAAVVVAVFVDTRGRAFFETGDSLERTLRRLAAAARNGDRTAFEAAFSTAYAGTELGLLHPASVAPLPGIARFQLTPGTRASSRADAVGEWWSYFQQFASIDELQLEVDRIQQWRPSSRVEATARFEIIGRLKGAARASIDRARLRFTFDRSTQGMFITSGALIDGERLFAGTPMFHEAGAAAGVAFRNRRYPGFDQPLKFATIRSGPGGISAADYDGDGWYDLFVPDGVEAKLLRNRGDGTFEDVTARAGLAGLDGVSVGVFADYDNDGFKDLFVSRTFRPNQLFHNRGDGTFEDVTARSHIGADCCTTTASWGDYDNDGWLDLYVGRYLDPRTALPTTFFYARNGQPNQLYHNNHDGTFTNVTASAGVGDPGLCLGTVWADYDDDGFPDLYVVNDFGRSTLYHNERNGTFTDVTVRSGTLAYGAGMNASAADYDNDGRLDFYTTDIRSDSAWLAETPAVARFMLNAVRQGVWTTDLPLYFEMFRQSGLRMTGVFRRMAAGNTLLRNKGDGTFEDVTAPAGANPPGWFWGAAFADFDNDGWQDIYAADGWIYNARDTEVELQQINDIFTHQAEYKSGKFFDTTRFGGRSWHGWERNRYLRNNGDRTFTEIGQPSGADLLLNSRGVAVADFLNRGRLDIAVAASGDRHALLMNDIAGGQHWLGVELTGTRSNRDAAGARITVRTAHGRQIRELVIGDGYGSQNSLRQYFGLADAATVGELTVRWPASGTVQTFRGVRADRIVRIVEGRDGLADGPGTRAGDAWRN